MRRLISAFVIFFLAGISKSATGEISIFWLVSVAEEADSSLALWETWKTGFAASRHITISIQILFAGRQTIDMLFYAFSS